MIPLLASLLFTAQAAAAPPQIAAPTVPPSNVTPSAPSQNVTPGKPSQNASPGKPSQNATPGKPGEPPTPDPATTQFLAEAGLVLVAIKPTAVADYELAIVTLQDALSKSTDETKSAAAKGWRVFKSTELDAKTNQLYLHLIQPTVPGFDYRPSLLIDELLTELAPELLTKYSDAFAMPPTKLNLTELANMSVAPLIAAPAGAPTAPGTSPVKPPSPNATPANVTPAPPAAKKPPGGR